MKGGENLHFRHVLITGLLVGAAFLLPDQAFAEKYELNRQQKPEHASEIVKTANAVPGQTNVPAKAEQAASPDKTAAVPQRALQNKAQVKQQTAKSTPQHAAVQKQAAISAKLPNQANGIGPSLVKKSKKAVKEAETKKAPMAREKSKRLENNKQRAKKMAFDSLHTADLELKDGPAIAINFEPQEEGSHLSIAEQEEKSIPNSEKRKSPASKEQIPAVYQGSSPTQRTGNSAGPSNDRVITGLNTISSVDKWFEWNKHYEINRVQPFFSRYAWMSNQWVNAPPSPPPKEAPFFQTVNRS